MMSESTVVPASAAREAARASIRATDQLTLEHMCDLTRIPCDGAGEAARGMWLAHRLRELDLDPVTDAEGNVHAVCPAAEPHAKRVVIAAHLDTVFDADTAITVQREGDRLTGPGISDNGRGVAALLAIARGLHAAGWPTRLPVAFVGTVAEEGAGDLRGVKHYIAEHARDTAAFIALDGAGSARIITAGVGSRRLRVTFRGPGGHSWSDWGVPNAIHAAGKAIAALAALRLTSTPRTTLSVGRMGGGTSVNAIPDEAWFEIDLRSDGVAALHDLETHVRDHIERARRAEARTREMDAVVQVIGDRPAGRTSEEHPLVRAAMAATRTIGLTPDLSSSSTDANVPMAAGIPSIAIGAGGDAGGMHTVREWYDNRDGMAGLDRALLVVLDMAGLRE